MDSVLGIGIDAALGRAVIPQVVPDRPVAQPDGRFRSLLGDLAWQRLPVAIRRRFSHHITGANQAVYRGRVVETRISRCGWLLAHAARLIGAPLPLENQRDAPTVVVVTFDPLGKGVFWTRQYARRRHWPQIIRSAKRFTGPTGLEEHIGGGVGLALSLQALSDRLVFGLDHVVLRLGRLRFRLPPWLTPVRMRVEHVHLDEANFEFRLAVAAPLLGNLLTQRAMYQDDWSCS